MSSRAEYFRRQADICLRLSLIASDDEVSSRLIAMAQGYSAKADETETASKSTSGLLAPSISPDRETNER